MNTGFSPTEAKTLLALIATTHCPTPPNQPIPMPTEWTLLCNPDPVGLSNKWQLWQNQAAVNQYAVLIRGTVPTKASIIEDLLVAMIQPAFEPLYCFATDPKAAVHLGFAIGALTLLYDPHNGILDRLSQADIPPQSEIYVAGHSQGAAVATLCRSFLAHTPFLQEKQFAYKTYLFAQPKPGNDHYADEFNRLFSDSALAFTLTNTEDWVPQTPLTIEQFHDLNEPNPLDNLHQGFSLPRLMVNELEKLHALTTAHSLTKYANPINDLGTRLADRHLPFPHFSQLLVESQNYAGCGAPITLTGTPGPNPVNPKDGFWQHSA
ncbi:MAG: hypothetical protein R2911_41260, partial [Caldilineaceae bacterium]